MKWGHVGERTIVVHAPKTRRHSNKPRTVRMLAPLAQDLREWRLASGRPGDDAPVIPERDGSEMTESAFQDWRGRAWTAALAQVGVDYVRPNVLRHSFVSLLLHGGRSSHYIARQVGNSPTLIDRVYGHVIDELEDAPRIPADEAIAAARRGEHVRDLFGRTAGITPNP